MTNLAIMHQVRSPSVLFKDILTLIGPSGAGGLRKIRRSRADERGQRVSLELESGWPAPRSFRPAESPTQCRQYRSEEETQGELSVHHRNDITPTTPRTAVRFQVPDLDPVEVPDLVVPPEQPMK